MANTSSAELLGADRRVGATAVLDPGVDDYVALLKPRVMSLVVFTGFVGLYVAPGHLHPLLAAVAVLCIAVGAGAAGAINMWYDRDIDAVMKRTQNRPLPAGRMAPGEALGFGCVLAAASVVVMGLAVTSGRSPASARALASVPGWGSAGRWWDAPRASTTGWRCTRWGSCVRPLSCWYAADLARWGGSGMAFRRRPCLPRR